MAKDPKKHGHRLLDARVSLERCDDEINRRLLARPGAGPSVIPPEHDDAAEQARRKQHRRSMANAGVLTPSRSGHGHSTTASSSRSTPGRPGAILNSEQLKDHYAQCIKLSANNKITGRNAFSLHLIDYMSHLLQSDSGNQTMNFKLATSALDAGTKIYVSRVDAVHSDAQRVADGINQALDTKGRKNQPQENGEPAIDENGEEIDTNNLSNHDLNDENEGPRVKKTKRKKKGKTIASIDSITVSKVEANVEIDPIFHKLTTSYDMANVNSLLLGNLQANNQNRLILDSNALLDKFKEVLRIGVSQGVTGENGRLSAQGGDTVDVEGQVDAANKNGKITKTTDATEIEPVLKDVLSKKYKLFDDPFFRQFNFTNREGSLDDMSYRRDADESTTGPMRPSGFAFDLNEPLEPDTEPIHTDPFHLDDGDFPSGTGFDRHSDSDEEEETVQVDENGRVIPKPDPIAHQSMMQAFNLEDFNELKNILSDKPGEYSYFSDRIKNSWAGPGYWKLNPFHRVQANKQQQAGQATTSRFEPPGTSKKVKKTYDLLDFNMNLESESSAQQKRGKKSQAIVTDGNNVSMPPNNVTDIKLRVSTLQKWQQGAERLLLPERIIYETSQLFNCGLREKMFSCVKYSGQQRLGSDGSQSGSVVLDDPTKDGGITDALGELEDLECPDDDGFPTERPFSSTADPMHTQGTQNPTMTINGLELVDEPHAIQTIQLPFSKFAKRIDVKKLKRVMIDMIKNPDTISLNKSLPTWNSTENIDGVNFSQIYQNLSRRISPQMETDMSPPIAFVTLLHLANENNLILQNRLPEDETNGENSTSPKILAMEDILIMLEAMDMEQDRNGQ